MKFFFVAAALAGVGAVGPGAGSDGELIAPATRAVSIDANDGVVFGMRWRKPIVRLGQFRTVLESFGTPGVSTRHRVVIVGSGEGYIRALDLASGRVRWKHRHRAPFETTITILAEHDDVPELAIATGRDGAVLALEVATGTVRWRGDVQADARAAAQLVDDTLLLTTVANKVTVEPLAASGTRLWILTSTAPASLPLSCAP